MVSPEKALHYVDMVYLKSYLHIYAHICAIGREGGKECSVTLMNHLVPAVYVITKLRVLLATNVKGEQMLMSNNSFYLN